MKIILALSLALFSINAFAAKKEPEIFTTLFKDKSACFILFNNNTDKIIEQHDPFQCAEQVSPCSTFKVPLSVMAFDQNIITQKTIFKWDGKDKGMPQWNHNQTPYTWLRDSVVWVSQQITPQLGMRKIKYYLAKFDYGNQNFSGDPYKNNGLTHAWLHSSLKISGDDQLNFMENLVNNTLPASLNAMKNTKQNMYLEKLPNGYTLYGKTGSWSDGKNELGWFIGYLQKAKQTYIVILNFSGLNNPKNTTPGGTTAKNMVKKIIAKTKLPR